MSNFSEFLNESEGVKLLKDAMKKAGISHKPYKIEHAPYNDGNHVVFGKCHGVKVSTKDGKPYEHRDKLKKALDAAGHGRGNGPFGTLGSGPEGSHFHITIYPNKARK